MYRCYGKIVNLKKEKKSNEIMRFVVGNKILKKK